jgi:TetR/AcrR family transcriptional regulator, transcriptional repressor for nem operon
VTGGALHHHFPTKKALAVAVIRERVARAVEQIWIEPIRSANTAAQGILGVLEQIADGNVVLGCPLGNLAIELSLAAPDFQDAIQDVFAHWRRTIAQKLRADQAAGILPKLDADAFATFVGAPIAARLGFALDRVLVYGKAAPPGRTINTI